MKKSSCFFVFSLINFICFLGLFNFVYSMGVSPKELTSVKDKSGKNTAYKLPVQEFHLFKGMASPKSGVEVTVDYKDFEGNNQKGTIIVPQNLSIKATSLFKSLWQKDFRFQNVNPFSKFTSVYQALKNNTTFFFQSDSSVWLVVNPVNNPLIVRNAEQKKSLSQESHNIHSYASSSESGLLAIFPAAGVLSINVNQTSDVGKLTPKVLDIFSQGGFYQILQPDKNPNELFFGLFAYTNKVDSLSYQNKKKSLISDDTEFIFSFGPLPDKVKQDLINSGAWKPGCPVGLDRLAYIQFGYHTFEGSTKQGALVGADVVAPETLDIFKTFYQNQIPIEKVGGGDVGGTGMFICRQITGEAGFSLHSYGTALDLSYYRNPYVGEYKILSNSSGEVATGKIVTPASELIFLARNRTKNGFNEGQVNFIKSKGLSEWGGHWLNRTDYMHFQTSPFFSYVFPLIDYDNGRRLFSLESQKDAVLHKFSLESTEIQKWSLLAQLYPKTFGQTFVNEIDQFDKLGEGGFYRLLYSKLQEQKEH